MKNHGFLSRCVAFLLVFLIVSPQSATNVHAKSNISSLSKKQTQLSRQLKNIKNGISQKQAYKNVLNQNIKSLQKQIDEQANELDNLNKKIEEKEAIISNLEEAIQLQHEDLAKRMCAVYKTCEVSAFELLLGAKDFDDLLDKADLVHRMSKQDADIIDSLNKNLSSIETEKACVQESKNQASKSTEGLADRKTKLERFEKETGAAISSLSESETRTQSKLNQILLEKQREEEQMSRIQEQYSKSEANSSRFSKGKYTWPVPGFHNISSPWGGKRRHKGIDIAGPGIYGSPIVAVADGVVIKSNSTNHWGSGWGYHVMISHGNGYATQYAHCSSVNVSVGQTVKAGQVIGRVGNTGHSFGAHLHFETWRGSERYNPVSEL